MVFRTGGDTTSNGIANMFWLYHSFETVLLVDHNMFRRKLYIQQHESLFRVMSWNSIMRSVCMNRTVHKYAQVLGTGMLGDELIYYAILSIIF